MACLEARRAGFIGFASQHADGAAILLEHQRRGLLHVFARHLFVDGRRIEQLPVVAFEDFELA